METALLKGFKPENDTSGAITAAISRVEDERRRTQANIPNLCQARADALMTSTPKAIREIEDEIREAHIFLEQLEILSTALQPKLQAALRSETILAFKARHAEVRRLIDDANAWWTENYHKLAGAIRDGLVLIERAEAASRAIDREYAAIMGRAPPGGPDDIRAGLPPLPPPPKLSLYPYGQVSPCLAIQLPKGPGCNEPVWWPRELFGRPRN